MSPEKQQKIAQYDPNGVGVDNGHFIGLPFDEADSEIVLLSVPWDVTTSYSPGTHGGPENILEASKQLDLYDATWPEAWKRGIFMRPSPESRLATNTEFREKAERIIEFLESGGKLAQHAAMQSLLNEVNAASEQLNQWVENESEQLLAQHKLVGIIGGDHSVPLGLMRALAKRHESFGILHIDAHMDLRVAYEGFNYSHASIMYNALQLPQVTSLVQLAVRDYCAAEFELSQSDSRIQVFSDKGLHEALFAGRSWAEIVQQIVQSLPQKVYISFDIDGLSPDNCPNTGTPVPGGLSYNQALYLLVGLHKAGKQLIGFDLSETAGKPNEWDAAVAARIAYKMALLALESQA